MPQSAINISEPVQTRVLLTGGSRGIGAAIAKQLEAEGALVYSTSSLNGDLQEAGTPRKIWDAAVVALGGVDVLINNAGVFEEVSIDADDEKWLAEWDRTMRINLTASANFARLAVMHFREMNKAGRIINIASRAAHRGDGPTYWHYAASKAGVVALTKTIARGYGKENILAFAVSPGMTKTDMVDHQLGTELASKFVNEIPLGRAAEPEEISEAVVFLALRAPPSMTGATLDVMGASYVR